MIDKVISLVLTLIVVLALSVFLFASVFSGHGAEQSNARLAYENEYNDLLIQSLLLTHENSSELTYESLLALSLQDLNTIVTVNGQSIDVEAEYVEALDTLVGENNYYFTIRPVRKGIMVSYILDGSPTMADKRQTVDASLSELKQSLQTIFGAEASVYIDIYILSSGTPRCTEFTLEPNVRCFDLDGTELYSYLMVRGFAPPYPEGYSSFTQWRSSTHIAQVSSLSESDWAAAAAYASYKYQNDALRRSSTNNHIIVAVADELTANSKADECLRLTDPNEYVFCNLCNDVCPERRAQSIINQTNKTLVDHGDLFIGFYSVRCDYEYNTAYNDYYLTPYTCRFLDDQSKCIGLNDGTEQDKPLTDNPPAGVNWCSQQACRACDAGTPAYCFHTNCEQMIIDDLTQLAISTEGIASPLNDLGLLTEEVERYVTDQLARYDFTIGYYNATRDRYVVQKTLTLGDGASIDVTFWVYD